MSQPQDPVTEHYIPIPNKYEMASRVTSKELRLEAFATNGIDVYRLPMDPNLIASLLPNINKLRCVRAKSLALRLLHGDIFTGTVSACQIQTIVLDANNQKT